MDDPDLLASLAVEAGRVADVDPDSLDRPVPWTDSWTVGEVVGHLGEIHRWATALCTEPGSTIRRRDLEPAPGGPAVVSWYAAGLAPMLSAFEGTSPDTVVHTWAGWQPRRWWLRRLAHETALHRWDVEAAGTGAHATRGFAAPFAVDGIDELFDNFVPLVGDRSVGRGETMHVHAVDADGEWHLTFGDPGIEIERTHARADVALRGPAADLLLLLWNRTSPDTTAVELIGDRALLGLWRRTVQF